MFVRPHGHSFADWTALPSMRISTLILILTFDSWSTLVADVASAFHVFLVFTLRHLHLLFNHIPESHSCTPAIALIFGVEYSISRFVDPCVVGLRLHHLNRVLSRSSLTLQYPYLFLRKTNFFFRDESKRRKLTAAIHMYIRLRSILKQAVSYST